jgi:hypothetical protein
VYYGCLVLLDIFSFGAIYACTAEISGFVVDDDVKEECARYVAVPRLRIGSEARTVRLGSESDKSRDGEVSSRSSSAASQHSDTLSSTLKTSNLDKDSSRQNGDDADEWHIEHFTLVLLYTSLRQGLTLKNWVLDHLELLPGIDVRRLITFGIIKGFLYRVHKYAIATSTAMPPAPPTSLQTSAAPSTANHRDSDTATVRGHHPSQPNIQSQHPSFNLHRPSVASTTSLNPPHVAHPQVKQDTTAPTFDGILHNEQERENGLPLLRFLDGMHCFDEICTELHLPERVVESKVRSMGEGAGFVIQR